MNESRYVNAINCLFFFIGTSDQKFYSGGHSHLKPLWLMYFLPQLIHIYGRSLVCNRLCNFKCTSWVNFAWQRSHANGFVPECRRRCVFKFEVELKRLLQVSHWCGFSPAKNENILLIKNLVIQDWYTTCKKSYKIIH